MLGLNPGGLANGGGERVRLAQADATAATPLQPVEVYQTGEGVIVLSNRPVTPEQGAEKLGAAGGLALEPSALTPQPTPSTAASPGVTGALPSEHGAGGTSARLWLVLAIALLLLAGAALLVRRRRRRSTARYAALLAGSEPIGAPRGATPPTAARPFAPVPAAAPQRSAAPVTSAEERSSPRSAPPPSGISAPPASERQWLSQPPPRNIKDPPE